MEGRWRVRAVDRHDIHARQHLVEAFPVGRLELALDVVVQALAIVVVDREAEAAGAAVVVLNKADRLEADAALRNLIDRWNGVAISARTGEGMEALLTRIDLALRPRVARLTLRIPYADGPTLAACYERGRVISRHDEAEGIRLEVEVPRRRLASLEGYRI